MKTIAYLILIFSLCSTLAMAQNHADTTSPKHIMKIYPLGYLAGLSGYAGEINLSYEYIRTGKPDYEFIAAWIFSDAVFLNAEDYVFLPLFFFLCESYYLTPAPVIGGSIKINSKVYFNRKRKKPMGSYRSIQFMYKFTHFENLLYQDDNYQEKLNANKHVVGAKILFGRQSPLSGKFVFDFYFGVGVRMIFQNKEVFYSKRVDDNPPEIIEDFSLRSSWSTLFSPTLHAGISIGYLF